MECRPNCAACCIAPSISSSIPGMPNGKPAGVRCVQLTEDLKCALFGKKERPAICIRFTPTEAMCGGTVPESLRYLEDLETKTSNDEG